MKTHQFFCIILFLTAACSPTTINPTSVPATQIHTGRPESTPTSRIKPAIQNNALPSVPTNDSGRTSTSGCIPALTPAGFFPDGERLLGYKDNFIQIYDLELHTIEFQIQMPARVVKAALSPDGQMIATGLDDYSVHLMSVINQKETLTISAHQGVISGLSFSPAGDQLITASEDSWVYTWSLDGQQIDAFQPGGAGDFPSQVVGIGLSADWNELATIPFDGRMTLWALPDHSLLESFEGSILGGYSNSQAAFSPDGQYLAQHLGAGGGTLSLWRIIDGKLLLRGENITTGVDFSPDGQYLAYGEMLPTGGGHVVIRTPDGSQLIYDLTGDARSLPGIPIFTPDGNLLVAVDYVSGSLLVWSTSDGRQLFWGEVNCP